MPVSHRFPLNESTWSLGFGNFFDQVEFLMDFSLLLTDEALKRLVWGVRQGWCWDTRLPWSATLQLARQ